jgi:tetratricopeptide (TPR) repeat protein
MTKLIDQSPLFLFLFFSLSFNNPLLAQSKKKLLKLANQQIEYNNCKEAIQYLDLFLEKEPDNLDVHRKRGLCLMETKQFAKAKSDFLLLEEKNSLEGDVYYHLAIIYTFSNDLGKADYYINKQMKMNDFLMCHYIKACILMGAEKNQDALKEFDYFISNETNFSYAYTYRALCYTYLGEFALADKDLKQTMAMGITADNQYAMGVFMYIAESNYAEALKYFQKSKRMDFLDLQASVFERACQIHLDQTFESNTSNGDLDALIMKNPRFSSMIGHAYLIKDKYTKADVYFSNAIQLKFESHEVFLLKAICQMQLNPQDCEIYSTFIQKAWKMDSSKISTLRVWVHAYKMCNNLEAAMAVTEAAYKNPQLDSFEVDLLKLRVLYEQRENRLLRDFAKEVLLPRYRMDAEKLHILLDTLNRFENITVALNIANRLLEINENDINARVKRLKTISNSQYMSRYELMESDFNIIMSVDSMNEDAWLY